MTKPLYIPLSEAEKTILGLPTKDRYLVNTVTLNIFDPNRNQGVWKDGERLRLIEVGQGQSGQQDSVGIQPTTGKRSPKREFQMDRDLTKFEEVPGPVTVEDLKEGWTISSPYDKTGYCDLTMRDGHFEYHDRTLADAAHVAKRLASHHKVFKPLRSQD